MVSIGHTSQMLLVWVAVWGSLTPGRIGIYSLLKGICVWASKSWSSACGRWPLVPAEAIPYVGHPSCPRGNYNILCSIVLCIKVQLLVLQLGWDRTSHSCWCTTLLWCIFSVSQATVTTTTPPVTSVCSGASTMTVSVAPTSKGLAAALAKNDVVLQPPLIMADTVKGVVGLATMLLQEPQSKMPSQAYMSNSMSHSQVYFLFQNWVSH